MKNVEALQNEFIISTDKSKLDIEMIHGYLSGSSYWAKHIPFDTVKKSIAGSCCFGLYVAKNRSTEDPLLPGEYPSGFYGQQVGFAGVITDHATFAYIADVFIIDEFRGNGLAKMLMETIMKHPDLQGLRRWFLATKDAHGLYTKYGFTILDKPERFMGLKPFDEYPKSNS
ncbi:MAG: GNAT family N-acetyltransferase [Ferruginibacter sp.]